MRSLSGRIGRVLSLVLIATFLRAPDARAQAPSVAREWNEALLQAIRGDFARPTVHARNLFHVSFAMYDAWAAYDDVAEPYLLGKTLGTFACPFEGIPAAVDTKAAREEAISYAAYRLLAHRFANSPGIEQTSARLDSLFLALGYDAALESTDYSGGSPAALGNHLAQCTIEFGQRDGANEAGSYANEFYEPANSPLVPTEPGNPFLNVPDRWQPLALENFIDQSGNVIGRGTTPFLGPEWGHVMGFALKNEDLTVYQRHGGEYWIYHDPGPPPLLNASGQALDDQYKWGFELVANWASHLDPTDGVMWDISPGSIGNIGPLPETPADYPDFYDRIGGGDTSRGHAVNPYTGRPYEAQFVPRGDYARVLAEFWADGPDSETPPGHWFTILNYVSDHPALEKRFMGAGAILDDLEWDVKAYFALGSAVHDVAVTVWGIKGWYDYVRPVSAIRYMGDHGQSSDESATHYSKNGLPLTDGLVEIVGSDDPLDGENGEHVGKIKLYTWRGHDFIDDPMTDVAGVGWILAENWWPYQRPSFVTPPFAGYVSGHSTFSSAAARVLTLFTGNEYFPGGMGTFQAPQKEFLVFEDGPSVDVQLQWATYKDAADQCSLSRIWGGIHPPADDIPGRRIGPVIAEDAFDLAVRYFAGEVAGADGSAEQLARPRLVLYPNPVPSGSLVRIESVSDLSGGRLEMYDMIGRRVLRQNLHAGTRLHMETSGLTPGVYVFRLSDANSRVETGTVVVL